MSIVLEFDKGINAQLEGVLSERNGFPIIYAKVVTNNLAGENYSIFNSEIAQYILKRGFPPGVFLNLIIDASEFGISEMPSMKEVRNASSSPDFQLIQDKVRLLVAVGFVENSMLNLKGVALNLLLSVASQLSNVSVKSYATLAEATDLLEIPRIK